jgi:hypothetical protein
LLTQLNVESGVKKLTNFIEVSTREIANLTRIVGKDDVNKLDSNDLVSMNRELAAITSTKWMNGEYIKQ